MPAGNITVLRRLQELGYDLGVASFSSAQEIQQKTLSEATGKVSITRHRGTKAQLVRDLGCCLFTDGQRGLCQEVEPLQNHRSVRNRCKAMVAAPDPSRSLQPLLEEAERSTVRFADRPLPSFLKSLN